MRCEPGPTYKAPVLINLAERETRRRDPVMARLATPLHPSSLQTQWCTITECVPVLVKHSRSARLSGFGNQPQLRIILISSLTIWIVFRQLLAAWRVVSFFSGRWVIR